MVSNATKLTLFRPLENVSASQSFFLVTGLKSGTIERKISSTKSPDSMAEQAPDTLLANSSLYQEFLAERDEIHRHKWLKSEEAGHDVGFETALVDWTLNHRTR